MPLTSKELADRRAARLQSIYEQVEAGVPVDWDRHNLLRAVESVQIGDAFVREAVEHTKAMDDEWERRSREDHTASQ